MHCAFSIISILQSSNAKTLWFLTFWAVEKRILKSWRSWQKKSISDKQCAFYIFSCYQMLVRRTELEMDFLNVNKFKNHIWKPDGKKFSLYFSHKVTLIIVKSNLQLSLGFSNLHLKTKLYQHNLFDQLFSCIGPRIEQNTDAGRSFQEEETQYIFWNQILKRHSSQKVKNYRTAYFFLSEKETIRELELLTFTTQKEVLEETACLSEAPKFMKKSFFNFV